MNLSIVAEHADEAGFLWELRDGAVAGFQHDLGSICDLDERIEAHLDGLRVAGDAGREVALGLSLGEPGEVFTAMVLAVGASDLERVAAILDAAADEAPLSRALVSALGWVGFDAARPVVEGMLAARDAVLVRHALGAYAAHRVDPGSALGYALLEKDAALRARALDTAGVLGRVDLAAEVRDGLRADDEACRFAAAVAGALLGERAATEVLWAFAEGGGARAERAAAMAAVRSDIADAGRRLEAMAGWPDRARAAIRGAAALGDPASIPWLLERMTAAPLARIAGDAFAEITGGRIEGALLGTQPEGFRAGPTEDAEDEDVTPDPDDALPWPDRDAIVAWWGERAATLRRGVRHHAGQPVDNPRALAVGDQRRRALAAFEIAASGPGTPLFEVRAPGPRQRAGLAAGSR